MALEENTVNKHNFFYFIKEGAFNMFSHGFMSFAAVGITVACLLIMGTFTLVAVNANAMLAEMESQNQMLAYQILLVGYHQHRGPQGVDPLQQPHDLQGAGRVQVAGRYFRLIEHKSVYDNMVFAMRAVGAGPKEIKKRIPYCLKTPRPGSPWTGR